MKTVAYSVCFIVVWHHAAVWQWPT